MLMLVAQKGISPFMIPDGYFRQGIEVIQTMKLPLQQSLFSVPAGFFSGQEQKLRSAAGAVESAPATNPASLQRSDDRYTGAVKKEGKMIALFSVRRSLAAAAVLIIIAGAWILGQRVDSPDEVDCNTIACLEERDLIYSRALENLSEDELLLLLGDRELERVFEVSPVGEDTFIQEDTGSAKKEEI